MLSASALVMAVGVSPAWATVTAVNGSAYGYRAYNISFFGGSSADTGPTPSVALASNASNSPQTATATSGTVVYGPATLFTSDGISVSSSGSTGASGSVTSSTSVNNINQSTTQPTITGSEIVTAREDHEHLHEDDDGDDRVDRHHHRDGADRQRPGHQW